MVRYDLGYGGNWQESFDDGETAIVRAEDLAASGEVVEVARRFLGLYAFVTVSPAMAAATVGRQAITPRRPLAAIDQEGPCLVLVPDGPKLHTHGRRRARGPLIEDLRVLFRLLSN